MFKKIRINKKLRIIGEKFSKLINLDVDNVDQSEIDKAIKDYNSNPTPENEEKVAKTIKAIPVSVSNSIEEFKNKFYLKNTNVPMPDVLSKKIIEHENNNETLKALPYIRFWKLCLANPNGEARDGIAEYMIRYGLTITSNGYMLMYKSVLKANNINPFYEFIFEQAYRTKNITKKPLSQYVCIDEDGEFKRVLVKSHDTNLEEQLAEVTELQQEAPEYTPHHKGGEYGNNISLGKIVSMERELCDPDINNECSYGLHLGAEKYVRNFTTRGSTILLCLASPMDAVAIPKYDRSKIRFCSYLPIEVVEATKTREFEALDDKNYGVIENTYIDYTEHQIEEILRKYDNMEGSIIGNLFYEYDADQIQNFRTSIKTMLRS